MGKLVMQGEWHLSNTKQWLSVNDVANYFAIHPHTVKRISPKELPYFRVGKRGDRRYRLEDVESFVERNTIG